MGIFVSSDIEYIDEVKTILEDTFSFLQFELNDAFARQNLKNSIDRYLFEQYLDVFTYFVRCDELNNSPTVIDDNDLVMHVTMQLHSPYTLVMSRKNGIKIETCFTDQKDFLLFKLFFEH